MRPAGNLTIAVGEAGKLVSLLCISKSDTEKPARGTDPMVDLALLRGLWPVPIKIKPQVVDNVGHTSPPVLTNIKHILMSARWVTKCFIDELRGFV